MNQWLINKSLMLAVGDLFGVAGDRIAGELFSEGLDELFTLFFRDFVVA